MSSNNSFGGINFSDPNSKNIFEDHNNKMCKKWNTINKSLEICDVVLMKNDNNVFMVNGSLNGSLNLLSNVEKLYIKYWASNAPTYSQSFSGSGLPYPNEEVAFQNSPNVGVVPVVNGKFSFSLSYPNSYYDNMGTVYVPPQVKVKVCNDKNIAVSKIQQINLGEGIPFRTQSWSPKRDWNNGPMFYCNNNLPVRTQYQILVDSAYPTVNTVPKNFWGKMPPH